MIKESGVYRIRNTANSKVYIGCSTQLKSRFNAHLLTLKAGKHNSREMQEDYDNGHEFEYDILWKTRFSGYTQELLFRVESWYIFHYNSYIPKFGYNKNLGNYPLRQAKTQIIEYGISPQAADEIELKNLTKDFCESKISDSEKLGAHMIYEILEKIEWDVDKFYKYHKFYGVSHYKQRKRPSRKFSKLPERRNTNEHSENENCS